jgi:hypothetical protein
MILNHWFKITKISTALHAQTERRPLFATDDLALVAHCARQPVGPVGHAQPWRHEQGALSGEAFWIFVFFP